MGLRKHCNPLTFRQKVRRPEWDRVFQKSRPLELDIGCGKGDFIFQRAQNHPEINFVGLDVREAYFDILQKRLAEYPGDNIHVIRCNVNASLDELFSAEVDEARATKLLESVDKTLHAASIIDDDMPRFLFHGIASVREALNL